MSFSLIRSLGHTYACTHVCARASVHVQVHVHVASSSLKRDGISWWESGKTGEEESEYQAEATEAKTLTLCIRGRFEKSYLRDALTPKIRQRIRENIIKVPRRNCRGTQNLGSMGTSMCSFFQIYYLNILPFERTSEGKTSLDRMRYTYKAILLGIQTASQNELFNI